MRARFTCSSSVTLSSKRREGLLGQSGCRLPARRKVSPLLGRRCSGQSAKEKILRLEDYREFDCELHDEIIMIT